MGGTFLTHWAYLGSGMSWFVAVSYPECKLIPEVSWRCHKNSHPERRSIQEVARRLLRMLIGSNTSLDQVFLGVVSVIPAIF